MSSIKDDGLIVYQACVCSYSMLYTDFPDLIGCSGSGETCCFEEEFCLKSGAASLGLGITTPANYICQLDLYCCRYALKMPVTCCKGTSQCLCCVSKAAFPPDDSTPIGCAFCFISLFPQLGLLKSFSEFKGGSSGVAPK